MPEDERIITLRISEGAEQLVEALERIECLERLLEDATRFIEAELKKIARTPTNQLA